jgi:hypothetical protein
MDGIPKSGPDEAGKAATGADAARCRHMGFFSRQGAGDLHEGDLLGDSIRRGCLLVY